MTLEETIEECLNHPELVKEYERLNNVRLVGGPPIHQMIDKASGYYDAKLFEFFNFIRDYIWIPTVMKKMP